MVQSEKKFVDVNKSLSEMAFCALYPHPFLLLTGDSLLEETDIFDTGPIDYLTDEGISPTTRYVASVLKSESKREGIRSMITVGRTQNNDIPIYHAVVSKFHCYFKKALDGGMTIVDIQSTNGTFVNGKQLKKNIPLPLKGGEEISFGINVTAIFLYPNDLYSRLGLGTT